MSTLLYGQQHYVEGASDEADARSTVTVVDHDGIKPEATTRPEFNNVERDPDTEGGLTTRDVSDYVEGRERYAPASGNANTDFSVIVDSQISTAGDAPAREAAGQWGHGSMQWSDATEPAIREGANFDNVYFAAEKAPIQDGAHDYMIPARYPDDASAQGSQEAAKIASRKAAEASLYARFLQERTR
ncbi:MAG TPA: hypothetical protein VJ323_06245 [Bryobacteraceae bacterium]|nr:hypothetical protein [Bryobacteraceae bacterium]